MKALLIALFAISSTLIVDAQARQSSTTGTPKQVVCVYDSTSYTREGQYNTYYFHSYLKVPNSTI